MDIGVDRGPVHGTPARQLILLQGRIKIPRCANDLQLRIVQVSIQQ